MVSAFYSSLIALIYFLPISSALAEHTLGEANRENMRKWNECIHQKIFPGIH